MQTHPLTRLILNLRALTFWTVLIIPTFMVGISITLSFAFPFKFRYRLGQYWTDFALWSLKWICGLDYEIKGKENIPQQQAFIILAKHQSTLETFVIYSHFPYVAWVIKRELLRIPFFGWALALVKPVAINRQAKGHAIDQIIKQGSDSLREGRCVVIFPEGTRTLPGSKPHYRKGGAILAEKTGYPIITLAHNAGEFWPRHSMIKWPGKVTFVIGPMITTAGKTAKQINAEARHAIETTLQDISDPARWKR